MRLVFFTGAGVSVDSGIPCYRGEGSAPTIQLTGADWRERPEWVLQHYNQRKAQMLAATPNALHARIAAAEQLHDVTVVTQNIDDLHERAGSTKVIHLHGDIRYARTIKGKKLWIGESPLTVDAVDERGRPLRPDIVLWDELVDIRKARRAIRGAQKVIVVGTSLSVFPANTLLTFARCPVVLGF